MQTQHAYLVACPNLDNLVLIEAEDESDAAEAAAMGLAFIDNDGGAAEGEYIVYPFAAYSPERPLMNGGSRFTADASGHLTN